MQEEMTSQSIALIAKTVDVSIDILKKLLDVYLDSEKNKQKANSVTKADNQPKVKQGKQSVKSLIAQKQGVENIDIDTNNIGLFTSSARKYGVDFAMTKDKNTEPPTHTIFFKGKDTAAITSAFKDFVGREENKIAKDNQKSLTKELNKLKKELGEKGKGLSKEVLKMICLIFGNEKQRKPSKK